MSNGALARWAEVDLGAVRHNVAELRALIGAETLLCAVVKADAYGHGARAVAPAALEAGADWVAVATVEEGIDLRDAGVGAPILVMGPVMAASAEAGVAAGLRLAVHDRAGVGLIGAAAARVGRTAQVHLKLDSGMTRLGAPSEEFTELARLIEAQADLELEAAWTHFAEAETRDSPRTREQLARLLTEVQTLAAAGIRPPIVHACNSAGAFFHPAARLSMVRCGIAIYGYNPAGLGPAPIALRPALAWKARLVAIHDIEAGRRVGYGGTYVASRRTRVGTVSSGYADGYSRRLSGLGTVLLRGRRTPVIGRISMDFITIDVTGIEEAEVGDEVVLLGSQGSETISADDLAAAADTISYEVLCGIGARVERVTVGSVHG